MLQTYCECYFIVFEIDLADDYPVWYALGYIRSAPYKQMKQTICT